MAVAVSIENRIADCFNRKDQETYQVIEQSGADSLLIDWVGKLRAEGIHPRLLVCRGCDRSVGLQLRWGKANYPIGIGVEAHPRVDDITTLSTDTHLEGWRRTRLTDANLSLGDHLIWTAQFASPVRANFLKEQIVGILY